MRTVNDDSHYICPVFSFFSNQRFILFLPVLGGGTVHATLLAAVLPGDKTEILARAKAMTK